MANYANGKVYEIGVDYGTKVIENRGRRDPRKSVEILKQEHNTLFMTRAQLCKFLKIK